MMALSRAQVRELDRRAIQDFGVPGVVLMENAGRGAAEILLALGVRGRVVICCGKGNNGGDGFVIARHLDLAGRDVRILLFSPAEDLRGEARVHHDIITRAGLSIQVPDPASVNEELKAAEWVVDALFGTGLSSPARPPFDRMIQTINSCRARVLAVDIPSGLDCDTGEPMGAAVHADHTVSFVAMKKGFLNPASRHWTGQVHVAGIGVPKCLLESGFAKD
jgi:NAD(P)H-hydrate epimerase